MAGKKKSTTKASKDLTNAAAATVAAEDNATPQEDNVEKASTEPVQEEEKTEPVQEEQEQEKEQEPEKEEEEQEPTASPRLVTVLQRFTANLCSASLCSTDEKILAQDALRTVLSRTLEDKDEVAVVDNIKYLISVVAANNNASNGKANAFCPARFRLHASKQKGDSAHNFGIIMAFIVANLTGVGKTSVPTLENNLKGRGVGRIASLVGKAAGISTK